MLRPGPFALLLAVASPLCAQNERADLAAARELFDRNIRAIQQKDRDAYLACYWRSERFVRADPNGTNTGFEFLAATTRPTGDPGWPEALIARDLRLHWIKVGLVYGTYRYRVIFGGTTTEGISERVFIATPDGWRIAVSSAFDGQVPAPPIALVGATVYDGAGQRTENATILLRDGKVEAFGSDLELPSGVDRFDLAGRFVTPGLIDTHVHYSQTGWVDGRPDSHDARDTHPYERAMADCEAHPERFHRAFLHSGVTAVFDVGGYPWTRRLRAATELANDAPHVVATGALLATRDPKLALPDRQQFVFPKAPDEARAAVRNHKFAGSDAIKFWFITGRTGTAEDLAPLVLAAGEEAAAQGLPFVVHATTLDAAKIAIDAGAHLLVHSVENQPVDDEFIESAAAAGTFYCPTLTVHRGYAQVSLRKLSDEVKSQLAAVHPSVRERVLLTETLPARRDLDRLRRSIATRNERRFALMAQNLVRVANAGIQVVLGTDAGNPLTLHGPSVFVEMEAMQAAGLDPRVVLRAATGNAAQAIGRGDDLGIIAPGRIADLVVLERDPGEDIANLRSITHVCRAGTLHPRSHLRW